MMEFLFELVAQITLRAMVAICDISLPKIALLSFIGFSSLSLVYQLLFSTSLSVVPCFVSGLIGAFLFVCLVLLIKKMNKKA